ncbi:MAG TPA: radical SAM protein [Tepidisphaeraceae bacterium]|jgi:wyosine [tRNA(Phe)-imidazoG37] synthetase (radical SAM superfamily)
MTMIQEAISRGAPSFWTDNIHVRPIVTRRYGGLALEIDVTPGQGCNLDCIYCEFRAKHPQLDADLDTLEDELDSLLEVCASGAIFDEFAEFIDTPEYIREFTTIVIGSRGEPTTFEKFEKLIAIVLKLMDRHDIKDQTLVLETNATLLHRPNIANSVRAIESRGGEIWCKLDAGSEELFSRIVRAPVPMARLLANISAAGRRHPIVIESTFCGLGGSAPSEDEMQRYLDRLQDLMMVGCRIKRVHVGTIAESMRNRLTFPLEEETIDRIAAKVRSTGVQVAAFYDGEH